MLNHQSIKNYRYTLPLLYFTAIVLWIYFSRFFNGQEANPLVLLFCLPFLLQLWFRSRMLSVVLPMLMLVWSGWMALAYASEYAQGTNASDSLFIILGGSFVFLNFLMAIWMFPAEMGKARQEKK
ncbi:hypothetical protein WJR50_09810 [Catalinimonas sp. 4WD22]|uniref:hypothetical protein n=1 Tax=Catalinimonas locisalis TaxID=3133978 RepID=UPI003100BCAD